MPFISAKNLCFSYGKKPVIDELFIDIEEGCVLSILGANGCGKSTLLKLFLGLLRPQKGEVLVFGKKALNYKRSELAKLMAYLPQSLFTAFSYSANELALTGRLAHIKLFSNYSKKDQEIVDKAFETLNIKALQQAVFNELSGGERQLVLIARALASEARVLLMDEPVSSLDFGNQMRLLKLIKSLKELGLSIIKTTHFPEHASLCSDLVLLLKNGKALAFGQREDVLTSRLLSDIYGIDLEVYTKEKGQISVQLP